MDHLIAKEWELIKNEYHCASELQVLIQDLDLQI